MSAAGETYYVGVAGGVYRDPPAPFIVKAAEVSGIDQGRAGGIEFRHEAVGSTELRLERGTTAEDRLEGVRGRREVSRVSRARHVGVAGSVHGDPAARITTTAAKVGRVNEGRAGGVELGYEDVSAAVAGWLEGPRSRRQGRGPSSARHVGVAVSVHGNAPGSADKSGVREHNRIDDQRPGGIVRRHLKADAIRALEHVAPGDLSPDSVDLLIDDGLMLAYVPT